MLHAALGVVAALGVAQRAAADIRGDNFDFPGFGEFQRVGDGDGNGVGLFACGAAGAPDAKRARTLPDFALLHFGQNFSLQRFVHRRIAEERRFLREQAFEQGFVLDARSANGPQKLGAIRQLFFHEVFADARGKETLARRIEQNGGPLLDQRADLVEMALDENGRRRWVRFHARHASGAGSE